MAWPVSVSSSRSSCASGVSSCALPVPRRGTTGIPAFLHSNMRLTFYKPLPQKTALFRGQMNAGLEKLWNISLTFVSEQVKSIKQ